VAVAVSGRMPCLLIGPVAHMHDRHHRGRTNGELVSNSQFNQKAGRIMERARKWEKISWASSKLRAQLINVAPNGLTADVLTAQLCF
jgi:hypothetical protein